MSSDFSLSWRGTAVVAGVTSEGASGIAEALAQLLEAANQRAPVDTGELRGSGRVETDGLQGTVVYEAPHAVAVHENLEVRHNDGQAKFLEAALVEDQRELLKRVAASTKKALGG